MTLFTAFTEGAGEVAGRDFKVIAMSKVLTRARVNLGSVALLAEIFWWFPVRTIPTAMR